MKKQSPSSGDAEGQPKYPEPLVLLVDLDDDAFLSLKDTGFNVLAGSFGTPYRVPSTVQGHETLCFNCYFPKNLSEQEIVIVDLTTTGPLELDETARPVMGKDGGIAFEANYREEFDPRPYTMFVFRDTFDRIISHGGIVVVFAQPRQHEEMVKITSRRRVGESIIASTWDFLWALRSVETVLDRGRDIRPAIDPESALGRLLSDHLSAAEFECTLEWDSDTWMSLAHNKYNNPVSALGVVEEGLVFIFPQIVDKASFLVRLLIEVLPEIRPSLFPHFEGRLWTRKSEYQVPDVLNLQAKITQIREDAEREIADLEKEIEELREAHSYLTDLITQQGEPLVRAVEKALQVLGFKDVVNVDELYVSEDGHPWLDEDLRITDRSPLLLVEVKGVKGVPTDEDALQVSKHLVARMKEREQTKIQGLTIINCERNLPPLERSKAPFRDKILDNAQKQFIGLMTTWTLYRLVRGCLRNEWPHDVVRDLFYQIGEIKPIPSHYTRLGEVEHVWEKAGAFGLIPEESLQKGETIAFDLRVDFIEEVVESLKVNDENVDHVEPGMEVGVGTRLSKEQLKQVVAIYRVNPPQESGSP